MAFALISRSRESARVPDKLDAALWASCRVEARPRLSNLVQRLRPVTRWDDLVLPAAQKQILPEIAVHVPQRYRVYETWGFAAASAGGLGVSALFTERGVPPMFARGGYVPRLDGDVAHAASATNADGVGARIARAVYGGFSR